MKKPATPSSDELIRIRVKIIPSASRNAITGFHADELVVKIAAPPEKGKANRELIVFLAQEFGLPKTSISIIRGETSHHKLLELSSAARSKIEGYRSGNFQNKNSQKA